MYKIHTLHTGETIIVLDEGDSRLSFGENQDNTDYQRYLAWVADGNTPEVIEP